MRKAKMAETKRRIEEAEERHRIRLEQIKERRIAADAERMRRDKERIQQEFRDGTRTRRTRPRPHPILGMWRKEHGFGGM